MIAAPPAGIENEVGVFWVEFDPWITNHDKPMHPIEAAQVEASDLEPHSGQS